MVLGNVSMIRPFGLLGSLLLMSCANAHVSLNDDSGQCVFDKDTQHIALQLKTPCSLVKVNDDGRYFYQYNNVKVYIVAGAPAALDELKRWQVKAIDKCSLQSQAVFITDGKMTVSTVRDKGLTCPTIGLDEKVYRHFLNNKQ